MSSFSQYMQVRDIGDGHFDFGEIPISQTAVKTFHNFLFIFLKSVHGAENDNEVDSDVSTPE